LSLSRKSFVETSVRFIYIVAISFSLTPTPLPKGEGLSAFDTSVIGFL
jgi:hypothetical protein